MNTLETNNQLPNKEDLSWLYPDKDKPKFSIIIPVFNEEKLLPRLLQSISRLVQPDSQCELLFIDNGSTDMSLNILKKAGVKVFCEREQGLRFARARGIKESGGEIIIQTDADSVLPTNMLIAYEEIWNDENVQNFGLVYGQVEHDYVHPLVEFYLFLARMRAIIQNYPYMGACLYGGPNMSYYRHLAMKFIKEYGSYPYVDEDQEMGRIFRSHAIRVMHTKNPKVIASGRKFQGRKMAFKFLRGRLAAKIRSGISQIIPSLSISVERTKVYLENVR